MNRDSPNDLARLHRQAICRVLYCPLPLAPTTMFEFLDSTVGADSCGRVMTADVQVNLPAHGTARWLIVVRILQQETIRVHVVLVAGFDRDRLARTVRRFGRCTAVTYFIFSLVKSGSSSILPHARFNLLYVRERQGFFLCEVRGVRFCSCNLEAIPAEFPRCEGSMRGLAVREG